MDADASSAVPGLSAGATGPAMVPEVDGAFGPAPATAVSEVGTSPSGEDGLPASSPAPRPSGRQERNPWRWVGEWAAVLVVALAVALAVRAFVVQTFYIPSPSMEPTLMVGD